MRTLGFDKIAGSDLDSTVFGAGPEGAKGRDSPE